MIQKKITFILSILFVLTGCETTPYYANVPGGSQQLSSSAGELNAADLSKLTKETLTELFSNNPQLHSWPQDKPLVKVPAVENLTTQLDKSAHLSNSLEASSLDFDLPRQLIKDELHKRGLATLVNDRSTKFDYYLKTYISQTSLQYDMKTGLPLSSWSMKITVEENKRRNPETIATSIGQYP